MSDDKLPLFDVRAEGIVGHYIPYNTCYVCKDYRHCYVVTWGENAGSEWICWECSR